MDIDTRLKVLIHAEHGMLLPDILLLLGYDAEEIEKNENDPQVIEAWKAGNVSGVKRISAALAKSADRGNVSAGRVLLSRMGNADDGLEQQHETRVRRAREPKVHDVMQSVGEALDRQRRLFEQGFIDDKQE